MTRVDRLPPQSPVAGLRRRRLSFAEVLAQSVSALAPSAAMVVVPSIVLVEAGAATLPAFVAATALVLLVGWCLTQFGRRMAAVGGTYSYTAKGLGPVGASIGGWALLIGYAAVAMSALVGSAAYLAGLFGLAPTPAWSSPSWAGPWGWAPPCARSAASSCRRGSPSRSRWCPSSWSSPCSPSCSSRRGTRSERGFPWSTAR